jgi:prevent-host-death family protein
MRITSTEAQNNFGKYLRMAADLEDVIITRNGRDMAKLVTCQEPLAGGRQEAVAEEAAAYLFNDRQRLTYEAFLEMTEHSDNRYEYIDGEVYLLASPSYLHQKVVSELIRHFGNWFVGNTCRALTSPFDVTLPLSKDNINVVQPDVLVLCDPERVNAKGRYEGIPSLVVEVLSPSTRNKDMIKKMDLYIRTGIREYWTVDPEAGVISVYLFEQGEIKEYQTVGQSGSVHSFLYEGLEIRLEDVLG